MTSRANEESASAASASTGRRSAARVWATISQLQRITHSRVRSFDIIHEAQPAELPARRRIEEIAVARARVARGRRLRAAAQDQLVDHELAVVLAQRAVRRAVARIRQIGAARPLP